MFNKNNQKKESGWGFIIIGAVMLLYVLGAMTTGSLGVAVFLGSVVAATTHLNGQAAVAIFTLAYIFIMLILLSWGIYTEFYS